MSYCGVNLSDKYTLLDEFGQAATCERTSMVARDDLHDKISKGEIARMKGDNTGNNCHQ